MNANPGGPFRRLFVGSALMLALGLALFAPPAARAHDPMSSWSVVRVRAETLELTVLFSAFEARFLLAGVDPEEVVIDEATFPRLEEQLLTAAKGLFVLSMGDAVLPAIEVEVVQTVEQDIEFTVRYARPAAGRLRINAAFLQGMSADHVSFLSVLDERDMMLGGFSPTPDDPNAAVMLPMRAPPGTSAPKQP